MISTHDTLQSGDLGGPRWGRPSCTWPRWPDAAPDRPALRNRMDRRSGAGFACWELSRVRTWPDHPADQAVADSASGARRIASRRRAKPRETLVRRDDTLAVSELLTRTGHAAVQAILALNRVYLSHRQLKWQRHLTTGLGLVPERFAERLESVSNGRPGEALQAAEALLGDRDPGRGRLRRRHRSLPRSIVRTPPGNRPAPARNVSGQSRTPCYQRPPLTIVTIRESHLTAPCGLAVDLARSGDAEDHEFGQCPRWLISTARPSGSSATTRQPQGISW